MRKKSWGEHHKSLLDYVVERQRFTIINKFIKHNPSILDLGCGYDAKLLNNFKGRIKNGVGIDLSVGTCINKIKLIKGRVDKKINLKSGQFDIVTSLAVIEHVDFPEIMLKESFRLLKKGGILLITTPSRYSKPLLELLAFKLRVISGNEIADHKRYYDTNTLKRLLVNSSFSPNNIKIRYFQLGLNIFAIAKK